MSDDLFQRAAAAIRQQSLCAPGQKILVAVSGGVDSMVLLHLLNALAPENGWQIAVAHFNHQLRGRAADADERLVRRVGAGLGLPVYVGRADVKSAALRSKSSIEMAARRLRHAFLAREARRRKFRTLALAHHAGDQVEHFFLRLLRGGGLGGMPCASPSPADPRLTLIRPLLGFDKAGLLDYARLHAIPWREDASNRSHDHLRNRLRNELLPLLRKKYQPGLDATVLRAMEMIRAESQFAAASASQWRKNARIFSSVRKARAGNRFTTLPLAVQRQVLYQELIRLGVEPDFAMIEWLRKHENLPWSIQPGLTLGRSAEGGLRLRRSHPLSFSPDKVSIKISRRSGTVSFADREFRWAIGAARPYDSGSPRSPLEERFDADKIGPQITLRHWRAGDRYQPIGMPDSVKLQDLFVNAKIPAARRRRLVLATTRTGAIFWVESLRIAEPFKITPQTRRELRWRLGA